MAADDVQLRAGETTELLFEKHSDIKWTGQNKPQLKLFTPSQCKHFLIFLEKFSLGTVTMYRNYGSLFE